MRPTSVYHRLSTALLDRFGTVKWYDSAEDRDPSIPVIAQVDEQNRTPSSRTVSPQRATEIVQMLHRMQTPITVDELTDQLLDDRDGTDRSTALGPWATLHERLHERELPALDAADAVDFDASSGLVELPNTTGSRFANAVTPVRVALVFVSVLFLLLPLASTLPPSIDVLSVVLAVIGLIAAATIA